MSDNSGILQPLFGPCCGADFLGQFAKGDLSRGGDEVLELRVGSNSPVKTKIGPFARTSVGSGAHRVQPRLGRRCHVFGRLSITRFALPSERSTEPGATTVTCALTPIIDLM